jgi:signal peptidase I
LDINQSAVNSEPIQPGKHRSAIVDILETLVLAIVFFLGINLISARILVDGASMEPTLVTGERVIVNRLSYKFGTPQQGDIIVFHYPRNPSEEYIKRVVGLPGDTVQVKNGSVYVNGLLLNESYLDVKTNYTGTWQVPDGQLFVLGDNRNNSSDSHDWGTVPMDYVVGKAILVYWPPADWGLIEHVPVANAAR